MEPALTLPRRLVVPMILGLALLGFASWAWSAGLPLAPVAAAATVGLALLGTREAFVALPQRHDARVVLQVFACTVLSLRRTDLAKVGDVAVERVKELVSTNRGLHERTKYVVTLDQGRFRVWDLGGPIAARKLGEQLARGLGLPLRDGSLGAERVRGFEDLDLNLGRRLLLHRQARRSALLPSGSEIVARPGSESELTFPPQPDPWWSVPVGLVMAAGAGLVFTRMRWPGQVAALPLAWLSCVWLVRWAASYRSTRLRLERDCVRVQGTLGVWRRLPLASLEELAVDGEHLWLVADKRLMRVPYAFRTPGEREYVMSLVEQAACRHPSAQTPHRIIGPA